MKWLTTLLYGCALFLLTSVPMSIAKKGPVKPHLKHVRCPVCEVVVGHLVEQVAERRKSVPARSSIQDTRAETFNEEWVVDLVEDVCHFKKISGDFWAHYDLKADEDTGKVFLVDMKMAGECNRECKTLTRACENFMQEFGVEITQILFERAGTQAETKSKLIDAVCRTETGVCKGLKKQREDVKKSMAQSERKKKARLLLGAEDWVETDIVDELFSRAGLKEGL